MSAGGRLANLRGALAENAPWAAVAELLEEWPVGESLEVAIDYIRGAAGDAPRHALSAWTQRWVQAGYEPRLRACTHASFPPSTVTPATRAFDDLQHLQALEVEWLGEAARCFEAISSRCTKLKKIRWHGDHRRSTHLPSRVDLAHLRFLKQVELQHVAVSDVRVGPSVRSLTLGFDLLTNLAGASGLERLVLMADAAQWAVAHPGAIPEVTTFEVHFSELSSLDVLALLRSPSSRAWKKVALTSCALDDDHVTKIVAHLPPELQSLDLRHNDLSPKSYALLLETPLQAIRLDGNTDIDGTTLHARLRARFGADTWEP